MFTRRVLPALVVVVCSLILTLGSSTAARAQVTTMDLPTLNISTNPWTETRIAGTGPFTAVFTVQNPKSTAATGIAYSCVDTGPVVCQGVSPSATARIDGGESVQVSVTYRIGGTVADTGVVRLQAMLDMDGSTYHGQRLVYAQAQTYGVAVTPDGSTMPERERGTGGHTAAFTVKNLGNVPNTFDLVCYASSQVGCSGVSQMAISLGAGQSGSVTATYSAVTTGTGWLSLTATGRTGAPRDSGYYRVPVYAYEVSVAPDGESVTATSGRTTAQEFIVTNTGTRQETFNFTCSNSGGVTCGDNDFNSRQLDPNEWAEVVVSYLPGEPDFAGRLTLRATGSGGSADQGHVFVTVVAPPPPPPPPEPTIVLEVPSITEGIYAWVSTRRPVIRARFLPTSGPIDTAATVIKWRSQDVTALARHNRGVLEWQVDSSHQLAPGDTVLLDIEVCDIDGVCATEMRGVVLPEDGRPILGFSALPLGRWGGGFTAPFGPGLTVSGAEIETGFSTPSYVSMGVAQSAALVYSTRQSYPRALVPVDLELPWPASGAPDQVKLVLRDGSLGLDSVVLTNPACATGSAKRCRTVLQGDFSASILSPAYQRKWLTVEVQVLDGGVMKSSTDSVEVVLVDRRQNANGSGWWPAAMSKLVAAGPDRVLIGPTGTATIYRGNGDSLYLAPPGVFTTLVKTGSGWELHPRGTLAKVVFDGYGRLAQRVDRNGYPSSIAYNGATDRVERLTGRLGKQISFGYNGSGKLATITDPGGRVTRVEIDLATNQLVYDSVSSPASSPAATRYVYQPYSGTNTVLLTRRIGVIQDTTAVVYDSTFRRRPVAVRLPLVQDTAGSWVNPVIGYTAVARQGYGAFRSLDSVYVQMTDPRGHWTRSRLNRWGQPLEAWDALGVIGRTTYTPDGLVLWTEGKTGDSSRVYTAYDALSRPVKTYFYQGDAAHVFRSDSVVYNTSHWVVERIDSRGKSTRFGYDAQGNVIHTVNPAGDTTYVWYRSDGLIDSTRLPGDTAASRMGYDTVWRNLLFTVDPSGDTLTVNSYDQFGRLTAAARKLKVYEDEEGLTAWQWRRTQTFYNEAGQVDSVRTMRTGDCFGCSSPTWPLASDTGRTRRVGYRYDRAGRDSLRLDDRGIASLSLYDRLGRLVSRRPWSDSLAVRDSLVYDLAGNVVKAITRRGDTITTFYDSRNRDTLSTIPGIGTLRKAYAGPAGQLTRMWYDNPVDPIGGVNGEVRWGYDLRGRLLADTSYTGATPRATSYTYDELERTDTWTNALGTWGFAYEEARGLITELHTPGPVGDTLVYSYDAQGRVRSLKVRTLLTSSYMSGAHGVLLERGRTYNTAGALKALSNGIHDDPYVPNLGAFNAGQLTQDPGRFPELPMVQEDGQPMRAPRWIMQAGAAGTPDTLRDYPRYNGWERLTSWSQQRNGEVVRSYTYTFDRAGNVNQSTGPATYDPVTNRLVSRVEGAGGRTFEYDRAGNLVAHTYGGNLERSFTYDALNRLVSVRRNGVLIARYAYDVLGRRIAKRVYSTANGGSLQYTRFVYHGSQVVFETDSAGAIGLRYVWGLGVDNLVAIQDAAWNHYYVAVDKLGSVRALVLRDRTWVAGASYRPYGGLLEGTLPTWLRYRWTGREYDAETGWYYHRSRYYSPSFRRFVQPDPIGYAGGRNLYAYVDGQVLEARDPSGLAKNAPTLAGFNCTAACYEQGIYIDGAYVKNGVRFLAMNPSGFQLPGQPSHRGGRKLTEEEKRALGNFCTKEGEACRWARIHVTDQSGFFDVPAYTPDNNIFFYIEYGPGYGDYIPLLAHEMTHVVQYLDYFNKAQYYFDVVLEHLRGDPYNWQSDYARNPSRPFGDYGNEQQGQIVQDCYARISPAACNISPYHPN